MSTQKFARVREVADACGVHPHTIRRAESSGVLPPPERDHHGWRVYRPGDVDRIERALFPRGAGSPDPAA